MILNNLSLIVAYDRKRAIGYKNKLLYNNKDDMKRFVNYTKNKTIIMGYNTWLSLPNKPLKGRKHIILTRDMKKAVYSTHTNSPVTFFNNPDLLLNHILKNHSKEFVIIGGEQIYSLFMDYCSEMKVTEFLSKSNKADTYFPLHNPYQWIEHIDKITDKFVFKTLKHKIYV